MTMELLNPYNYNLPVSAEMFYGRKEILNPIIRDLVDPKGNSIALIGGRRIGKTSLLEAVVRSFEHPVSPHSIYVVPVFIDLSGAGIKSPLSLFQWVSEQVCSVISDKVGSVLNTPKFSSEDAPAPIFSQALIDWNQAFMRKNGLPLRLVLILDECEQIAKEAWAPELYGALRYIIVGLSTRSLFKVIMVGSQRFFGKVRQEGSPLGNVLNYQFLHALDVESARSLIVKPFARPLQSSVVDTIMSESGRHPFLIQYIMHHLWIQGVEPLNESFIKKISRDFPHYRGDFEDWFFGLTITAQKIYAKLSEEGKLTSEADLKHILPNPRSNFSQALQSLLYHGLVLSENQQYIVGSKMFQSWFTDNVEVPSSIQVEKISERKSIADHIESEKSAVLKRVPKLALQESKGKIDFGIITIRDDEFRAILARFPKYGETEGNRRYVISAVTTNKGNCYSVAIVRCPEQGEGEGQDVARDMILDLRPNWLLLVGIAGGVPDDEFTLGDVVVATRLHDFCVGAEIENRGTQYAARGGPMHPAVKDLLGFLPSMDEELDGWNSQNSIGIPRPSVSLNSTNFYGDDDWKRSTREKLLKHFGKNVAPRGPKVITGPIASSDKLIKNTNVIAAWRESARQLQAVEMELAGVYQAARRKEREYPILAIRGISDIVGYRRRYEWTAYACASAASFTYALLKTAFIDPLDSDFAQHLISGDGEKA